MLLRPQLNFRSSSFLLSTIYSFPPPELPAIRPRLIPLLQVPLRRYFAHFHLLLNTNLHRYPFTPSPAH
ncbi:hypothetical protein CBS115989_9057 [Aspergillus niger]|nr:hypothetical protein CBS115989_9057 [Aspergillus niger]KAI2861041.1 hypothetical protein CBS11232_1284 [Aspergillus niger]KAI2879491.1 hypothetical protein CBS115988_2319 [Aspergillus niger]KAI2884830.1 hypothetical protein CBS11852_8530 [Aspergillus niger]